MKKLYDFIWDELFIVAVKLTLLIFILISIFVVWDQVAKTQTKSLDEALLFAFFPAFYISIILAIVRAIFFRKVDPNDQK